MEYFTAYSSHRQYEDAYMHLVLAKALRYQQGGCMNNVYKTRDWQIAQLQTSLKRIRAVIGWSGQELSDLLGVSRQTTNNIETNKTKMTVPHYLATCAAIDRVIRISPALKPLVMGLLPVTQQLQSQMAGDSLVETWFETFPELFSPEKVAINQVPEPGELALMMHNFKVFVHYDVFMHDHASEFVNKVLSLSENSSPLILPVVAAKELITLSQNNIPHSREALQLIQRLQDSDMLELRGERDDPIEIFDLYNNVFTRCGKQHPLCLLTQDDTLANAVLKLNNATENGLHITAAKLDNNGEIAITINARGSSIDDEILHNDICLDAADTGQSDGNDNQHEGDGKQRECRDKEYAAGLRGWGVL
jgi:DNA-binding XRE family transcriptional regulator